MKYETKKGYIKFHLDGDAYIIDDVKSFFPRSGYGKKLVSHVEKYVSKRSVRRIELFAEPQDETIDKESLFSFYRNLGYEDNEFEGDFSKEI